MKVSRLSAKKTCMPIASRRVLDQRALGHVRERQVAQQRARLLPSGTRFRPAAIDQAKVAKLCITPLGVPVVPEVYMIGRELVAVAQRRLGAAAACAATIASQLADSRCAGAERQARCTGSPSRNAGAASPSQPSSLPTNSSSRLSCARGSAGSCRPRASGTAAPRRSPAIQIAKSASSQWAQFLERMRDPAARRAKPSEPQVRGHALSPTASRPGEVANRRRRPAAGSGHARLGCGRAPSDRALQRELPGSDRVARRQIRHGGILAPAAASAALAR